MIKNLSVLLVLIFGVCACAGTSKPSIVQVDKPTANNPVVAQQEQHVLKRKVAIARFGNEAQYSKSNLFGMSSGYNAEKQATDILSAKLTQSGKFIMLERSDEALVNKEINTHNLKSMNIGADYLIVGSVSEFGRKNVSSSGVFSRSMAQTAYAKVSVRLIDVSTGEIIFAQEGSGEATSEAGKSFGIGKHVGYDSTLNDKAVSTAISSVVDGIMSNLLNKPWRSYVLDVSGDAATIAGGARQGIMIGETFDVMKRGKEINNPQTGMLIELPGTKIAELKAIQQFGSNYSDEGTICSIEKGVFDLASIGEIYVQK